jgi:CRP-like cAMP-binding protein
LFAKYGQVRSTEVGEFLFRDGDATYDAMVLMEGRVAIVLGSGDAERELAISWLNSTS